MEFLRQVLGRLRPARVRRPQVPARPAAEDHPVDRNALYDRQTVEVMRRHLRPDSVCIDVGAHAGGLLESMVALAPAATHHAFEPLPHLAGALRGRFPSVAVHQCALGDRDGEAAFAHVVNDPGYSGLRRRLYDRPDPVVETIRVRTATLDGILPAGCAVAFVKIDVEGGEYHVLRGGAATIQRCRPLIVFEASARSTGQYGVAAHEMYRLIADEFGMHLSTMGRWLGGRGPLGEAEFCRNWDHGPDYYFLAYP